MRGAMSILFMLGAAALPGTLAAAPPPPPIVPEHLRAPMDGYDLRPVYSKWLYWIEGQKGAAADALLAAPDELAGEKPFGQLLLRFTKHHDFGHYLTGEIRTYCRPAQSHGFVPGTCHHLLRRAFVPHDAATYGGKDNEVSRWMKSNFDSEKLVRHFRASGWGPETDWWRQDAALMFAPLPSPLPMLKANATVVRLDSRDCPAMAEALASMEGKPLPWRIDLHGVGRDSEGHVPPPHSVTTEFTLRTTLPAPGGYAAIEGSGPAFQAFLDPILDAADACEAARPARAAGS